MKIVQTKINVDQSSLYVEFYVDVVSFNIYDAMKNSLRSISLYAL